MGSQMSRAESGESPQIHAQDSSDEGSANKLTVADMNTPGMDIRFPTTNQSRRCFINYQEYYKCISEKGEEDAACKRYKRMFSSICPMEWVEKWEEQRAEGTFVGKY